MRNDKAKLRKKIRKYDEDEVAITTKNRTLQQEARDNYDAKGKKRRKAYRDLVGN